MPAITIDTGLTYDSDVLQQVGTKLVAHGDAFIALADKAKKLSGAPGAGSDDGATVSPIAEHENFQPATPPLYTPTLNVLSDTAAKYDTEVRAFGTSLRGKGEALIALAKNLDEQEAANAAKMRDIEARNAMSTGGVVGGAGTALPPSGAASDPLADPSRNKVIPPGLPTDDDESDE